MKEETARVSAGRLPAVVAVALIVAVSAVVVAFLAPLRFDGVTRAGRLGAIPVAGTAQEVAGDLAQAAQFYGQLSRIDPDERHRQTEAEAHFLLAEHLEKTDPERALEHFRASCQSFDTYRHGWPWFKMGALLAAAGRDDEADERFARAMEIDDGRLALLAGYERGKIAVRRGRPEEAWPFFYRFLRFYPYLIEQSQFTNMLGNGAIPAGRGLYVVGRSMLALGNAEEARPFLLKYLQEFPKDLSGRFYAAQVDPDVGPSNSVPGDLLTLDPQFSTGLRRAADGLVFYSNGRLMADVYVEEDETRVTLQITSDGAGEVPFTMTVLGNAQSVFERSFDAPLREKILCRAAFSLRAGHNVVEVALQHVPGTPDPSRPVLKITSLSLIPEGTLL